MSDTLEVQKREQTGSLRMKRLRQTGQVPAVLYGHGQENIQLTVSAKALNKAIDHGSFVVKLTGASNDDALIKDVQWDAFGIDILHVDFTRVNPNELVEVTIPLELRGDSPGAQQGGALNFSHQEITILTPAKSVPESLDVDVSGLEIDQTINVGDVKLPEGCQLVDDENLTVVSCELVPVAEDSAEEGGESAAETGGESES